MTTRNAAAFEVRPSVGSSTRNLPLQYRFGHSLGLGVRDVFANCRFRSVVKDRELLGRTHRSVFGRRPSIFRLRASTDSTDTEVVGQTETAAEVANVESDSPMPSPEDLRRKALSELKVGDVLPAVVRTVVSYGCFLDAQCVVDVFVHISDITPTFLQSVDAVLKVGDKVTVELLEVEDRLKGTLKGHNDFQIEEQERPSRPRGRRQSAPSRPVREYDVVEDFEGVVERVLRAGAFVKFDDSKASGFLPVEEMEPRPEGIDAFELSAQDIVQTGQIVSVRVIYTEDDTRRLTLSMRSYEDIEFEKKGLEEGFFIQDEPSFDDAILSAAFKRAGIVDALFENSEKGAELPSVTETKAVLETNEVLSRTGEDEMPEEILTADEEQAEAPVETDPVAKAQSVPAAEEAEDPQAVVERETLAEPDIEPEPALAETEEVVDKTPEPEPIVTADEAESVAEPDPEAVVDASESGPQETAAASAFEEPVQVEDPGPEPEPLVEEAPAEPEPLVPTETIAAAEGELETKAPPAPERTQPNSASSGVSVAMIKELRETTGAGMMDCKKALTECGGNMEAATEFLQKKGIASAAKRAGKVAAEGLIASYIHTGANLGILLEVNCETDFVARTDAFREFVDDVTLTIAANPDAICVSPEDYPTESLEQERQLELGKEDLLSKPEAIREKIVAGRLEKIKKTAALLQQPFIRDQNITVQSALTAVTSSLGEKISIRRFERYELGEGLEKKSTDFASEVADQIASKKAEAAAKTEETVPPPTADTAPEKATVKVPASLVKELRGMTGGGMMDCKKALVECEGDVEKAVEYLRQKGLAGAAKKAGRLASEGVICSYIHLGSKLGILAEVNCETDFVSRGAEFKKLAGDIAMQLAAYPEVEYISEDAVPSEVLQTALAKELEKEDLLSKPEAIRAKIAEGRVQKTIQTMCLLSQPSLMDTSKTIGDAVKECIAALGENIKVRRFVRFNLGEGIEKTETDFAAEVAEQTQKLP